MSLIGGKLIASSCRYFTRYDSEAPQLTKSKVFGPMAIRKMFPGMLEIASQMVLKWDRLGADHEIDLADDFTRLGK